ncbi:meiosis protein mei2 [Fusarium flagelliforme]|uniref:Meiosis protein mei2 n=1 Tax=Fusarium flagelliforme TaxID=2675880 RepID=A0A395M4V6_9HYPO|nr:meiosis protein mei2 [Fusarium flagelliforme]
MASSDAGEYDRSKLQFESAHVLQATLGGWPMDNDKLLVSATEVSRQTTPPTKNGHAPPPTKSRKGSLLAIWIGLWAFQPTSTHSKGKTAAVLLPEGSLIVATPLSHDWDVSSAPPETSLFSPPLGLPFSISPIRLRVGDTLYIFLCDCSIARKCICSSRTRSGDNTEGKGGAKDSHPEQQSRSYRNGRGGPVHRGSAHTGPSAFDRSALRVHSHSNSNSNKPNMLLDQSAPAVEPTIQEPTSEQLMEGGYYAEGGPARYISPLWIKAQ